MRTRRSTPGSASLAVLLGAVVALLAVPPVSAAPWPADRPTASTHDAEMRTIALGMSIWNGREIADLDTFTASVGGHTPASWSIWTQWGSAVTRDFPTSVAEAAEARGATPIIWWEPVNPGDLSSPTYARLANISAGMHDTYIRDFARGAKAFASPVIVRFAHEANGGSFPWGRSGFDNTPATFVEAWRHVHRIFRAEGADNVRFLWSVAKQSCPGRCNPYTAWYPGDAYVDYLGFSSFNWGAQQDEWVPMVQGYRRVTELLSEIAPKPIIAAESACNPEGGDKTAWIKEGYRAVYDELPQIVSIAYLNVDLRSSGHPDWRLTSPQGALDAYADIAAMPEFQGHIPAGT